ncbi:MAG: hypothetical protein LBL18_03650, partial [Bacteroidales bacterium]|nr:hypothetical protein [Bacteroidales bacterium]
QSVIKNLISIGLFLFVKNQTESRFRFKKWAIALLLAVAVIVPFVVFPMDVLYNKIKAPEDLVNEKAFELYRQEDSTFRTSFNVDSGRYMIGFVSSSCKYCKTGNAKIHQLVSCNEIDKSRIKFIIVGDSASVKNFKEETQTTDYQYLNIDPYSFLNITNGAFPKYIYVENGKITKAVNSWGIDENELKTKL